MRPLVVASEYERLTRSWVDSRGLDARVVRSYGATEVFPPEDADVIVDNTATGATLAANHLAVVDELMRSSTRLYANAETLGDPERRAAVERLVLLVRSVLEARRRVMVEVNVTAESLPRVLAVLPAAASGPPSRRSSGSTGAPPGSFSGPPPPPRCWLGCPGSG